MSNNKNRWVALCFDNAGNRGRVGTFNNQADAWAAARAAQLADPIRQAPDGRWLGYKFARAARVKISVK